jgi:hypothetical protein
MDIGNVHCACCNSAASIVFCEVCTYLRIRPARTRIATQARTSQNDLMLIRCCHRAPPADPPDFHARWNGPDQGVITCWLRGLEMRSERPELAAFASAGALPVLPWRGGVSKAIKTKHKVGAVQYLAAWQGLRGEDLEIDLANDRQLTCSRTGVLVTFTASLDKLRAAGGEEES